MWDFIIIPAAKEFQCVKFQLEQACIPSKQKIDSLHLLFSAQLWTSAIFPTQGALLQAGEEKSLCVSCRELGTVSSHFPSQGKVENHKLFQQSCALQGWKFILLKYQLWLCPLIMGKWLLADPGESLDFKGWAVNKYQQQARSTGRSRWGFSRSAAFLVAFKKIWESRVYPWANRQRRGEKGIIHEDTAVWGYGLMGEFPHGWFCPTGMIFALHIRCSPHRKSFIAFSPWFYVSLSF